MSGRARRMWQRASGWMPTLSLAASVRNKILAVLVLGIGMVVAGALYGFAAARGGLATVAHVNDTLIAQAIQAQAVEAVFKEQIREWMAVLVRGHDKQDLDRSWKQFTFREREVRRGAEKLRDTIALPEARERLQRFLAVHATMGERYRGGLEAFRISGANAQDTEAEVRGIDLEPSEQLEELVKLIRDEAQEAVAAAREQATRALMASLVVIAVAAAVALLACALLIMRTVVRPLAHAVGVIDRVAAGDLTVEVKAASRDEIGRLLEGLRNMRDGLAGAVAMIRRSADSVGTASRQIAEGHADLSSRTEEQAAGLEEAASSMEQLATAVRQNTESARHANALATGASETAGKGGQVMESVAGTMGGISEASRKIGDIVGLIDSIAFQTNILALNAAVEAARAGEQGRGFAVVAAEVRALAQRSATAAKEIRGLIQNSVDRVGKGTGLVESAGTTMKEIVDSVRRVTETMSQISASSQEQLSGIEQVSGVVSQMDRVVQQNAALVAESAAAAENLRELSDRLLESVARFRLGHDHDVGESMPAPTLIPAPAARKRPALRKELIP